MRGRPGTERGERVASLVLAFGSGFGILVLEVAGARLLADTYGLSSVPWTVVVATVLAGLAVGNTVGGILVGRARASLPLLFLGAGLWALVPAAAVALPDLLFTEWGFFGGVLGSAAIFFLIPSVMMGAVTPVLVARDTGTVDEVGARFGGIGAWSTAGAIVGTVAGGFLFLPAFSLSVTFALASGYFILCAALAAAAELRTAHVALSLSLLPVPAFILLLPSPGEGTVFFGQSLHASTRVVDSEWYGGVPVRELWQNGSRSSAEHRFTGDLVQSYQLTLGHLVSDRIDRIGSVLVLGGAANAIPSWLKRQNPELRVTVVEIDPMVERVAREFFSYGRLEPGALEMRIEDARPFLRRDGRRYDVVIANVYDHLYSVPWPMLTREAFGGMSARLEDGGFVAMTLSTPVTGEGARLLRRTVATLETVFTEVQVYPTQPQRDLSRIQEVILVGARDRESLPKVDLPWLRIDAEGVPFRDDYAPVEFLQALRFLFHPAW